jgi:tetratricopeptide (TPR) repeat protein
MKRAMRWRLRGALVLFAATVLMVAVVGCGESATDQETTTSATKSVDTTGGGTVTSVQTVVVGGDTAEEYEAALPDLEAAVAANQDDLKALEDLAVAQYQTGRYEEAAATYEKMLAIGDDAFMRNNYANVLRDWGKTDEAEAQYRKAIDTDPSLAFAYSNLAILLSKQGDNEGALALLESGLDKVPGENKTSIEGLIERLTAATTTT